jgi:pyruvate kinase
VRKGSDIDVIRATLGAAGAGIKIVAKIENHEGLENFDEILDKADGIMVARGDLGMEIPPEKVFLAQKMMIRKCNIAGKPVITATQMLESMIKSPRPTRAEASDVANAVLDGTDAVMLSGETANGGYPLEAVDIMARICTEAEAILDYNAVYTAMREIAIARAAAAGTALSVAESISSSAVKTALDIRARTIIVCSETGNSARMIAKYRPEGPVLVLTATEEVARWVNGLFRGCRAVATGSMLGTDALLIRAVEMCRDWAWVDSGDRVVAVHGMIEGHPGSTNMLKVLSVP